MSGKRKDETVRPLEERVDFLEATVNKLWDELYKLQEKVEKVKP